ncbi:probable GTP diphosphokinase CRSH, chloroplastic at N-terminal half [Coccomyxa sp. Obi]|nr:probable GTP diphosphokinase CRSH, chloroplastic at N-terminal half [Coccomyxa sp. Obi]
MHRRCGHHLNQEAPVCPPRSWLFGRSHRSLCARKSPRNQRHRQVEVISGFKDDSSARTDGSRRQQSQLTTSVAVSEEIEVQHEAHERQLHSMDSVQQTAAPSFMELVSAWDQLAQRLPEHAGNGNAAALILNALKLSFAHSAPPNTGRARQDSHRALALASQLADLSAQGVPLDAESIAAGIVASAVHEGQLPLGVVEDRLGPIPALLIRDMLKVRTLPQRCDVYDDVATGALRELCLNFYDARAIVVEVCRRADDLCHSLGGAEQWQRQLAALEALQIFAPMGHALGLVSISAELEDRCFQELFPRSYAQTAEWLWRERTAYQDTLARCQANLKSALKRDAVLASLAADFQIQGRTKSLYSTMKKLLRLDDVARGGRGRDEVYDLLGLRVIVIPYPGMPAEEAELAATQACYRVREVAKALWESIEERDKDYIAAAKPNGYRSLHSTLRVPSLTVEVRPGDEDRPTFDAGLGGGHSSPEGLLPLELQIRTKRMHEEAQSGESAHTAYKGGLAPDLARRLHSFLEVSANVPALPARSWNSSEAAAEELFRHLDTNGDGCVSEAELKQALGDLGFGGAAGAAAQEMVSEVASHSDGVTLPDFLRFVKKAGVLEALPRVDIETAQDLQRCQQTSDEAHSSLTHTATHSDDATSSVIDITHHSSFGGVSNHENEERKEHILVRRPRENPSDCSNGPDADSTSPSSVWDSYNAEEEALLMQGRPSTALHPTAVTTTDSRQSSSISADDMHRGRSYVNNSTVHAREQRNSWDDGSSSAEMYHNDVVPFSKRDSSPESRARSPAEDGANMSLPRGAGGQNESGSDQTYEKGALPAAAQLSNGRHLGGESHVRGINLDGGSFPSPMVLRTRAERSTSTVAASKPKGRRGAAQDVDLDSLPSGLKAAEHKGHPWIRCSHFALLPVMGGDLCSVRDASGNMLSAQDKVILLPQRGPLIVGAVDDADADVILDAPTVSGRHARLEIVPAGEGRRQSDFRCILTDLGSTNGTWVNRARLRAHSDTQIRSRDTVAFGDSAVAFRVVALAPDNIPSALETAVDTLVAYQTNPVAGEQGGRGVSEVDSSLVEKHAQLLSQARSLRSSGTVWLQLANTERRLAKRGLGGSFGRARAYYRASCEALEAECGGSDNCGVESPAEQIAGSERREPSEQSRLQRVRLSDCESPDGDARKTLGRAFRSWARMEGFLGHSSVSRRLFRQAVAVAAAHREGLVQAGGIKTLLVWAHQEKKNGHLARARQLMLEALKAQPSESKALCLLGCVEAELGDTATARKHFQAGLTAEPSNLVLLGAWARVEAAAGCLDRARELFQTAYAQNRDNIVLLQEWAVAETRAKNFKAARDIFARALALNPRHVPALAACAHCEGLAGQTNAARNLYARALQVDPSNVRTLCAVASLERRSGHLKAARVHLRNALSLEPYNSVALQELSMVEQAAGNYGKATALRNHARERRFVQDRARNTIARNKGSSPVSTAETDTSMGAILQGS